MVAGQGPCGEVSNGSWALASTVWDSLAWRAGAVTPELARSGRLRQSAGHRAGGSDLPPPGGRAWLGASAGEPRGRAVPELDRSGAAHHRFPGDNGRQSELAGYGRPAGGARADGLHDGAARLRPGIQHPDLVALRGG